jgi:hypothetical protein
MADAAEAPASGPDVSLQHLAHAGAEHQVGMADDAGADPGRAVAAGGAHRRDAVGELRLADRTERLRPLGAVHGAALHEDGGDDSVALPQIRQQLRQQVAPAGTVPEVVVRIDDGQVGLQRLLGAAGKPLLAHRDVVRVRAGAAHLGPFPWTFPRPG